MGNVFLDMAMSLDGFIVVYNGRVSVTDGPPLRRRSS
jgi:hypothetical protein